MTTASLTSRETIGAMDGSTRRRRASLLRGVSGATLCMLLASTPAHAQLAAINAALGHTVGTATAAATATATAQASGVTPTLTPTMNQIVARHTQYQQAIQAQANIVSSANAAARAAARAAVQTVANGLVTGGLVPAVRAVAASTQDSTGLAVWQGAALPTQTTNTTTGAVNVTINQSDSRALLSWDSFNIGRDTTLTFNQQGHSDWVAVNRVVGGINPTTGLLDPSLGPTPSQIKADGTVYILNRSGVLFGATAQVDLHSLVVSLLELGQTIATNPDKSVGASPFVTKSVKDLNDSFLQNGILPATHSGLLGYIDGETHGDVTVASGAQIRSTGGFVIIAAPKVTMAGQINPTTDSTGNAISTSPGSQVSLVAGKTVDAITATGADGSIDPNVRGLVLVSTGGGTVDVSGSINAPQGYISLVTDPKGTINLSGVLSSSTSVSRNGKIALIGGTVNLQSRSFTDASGNAVTQSATINITADTSGATIPQSTDALAAFKTSQIDIGNLFIENAVAGSSQIQSVNYTSSDDFILGTLTPTLFPSLVAIGANSMISAPGADVNIGRTVNGATYRAAELSGFGATGVSVGENAVIDVSGLDSVQVAASRNQVTISPAKKNELRDTPLYRDVATGGNFSLNGATLYVDARDSGVRSDGVAWVGSPLLEAGSLAAQIGITAPELMTRGGNVTMATATLDVAPTNGTTVPSINIAKSATIDFSGGWVDYAAGILRKSKLITSDGRIVSVSDADPNDSFVAVAGGFVQNLPQLSNPRVYNNPLTIDSVYSEAYYEGHDAGSLALTAPTMAVDSTLHGDAVAGSHQVSDAQTPTASSTITADPRKLQAVATQLPAAGLLRINTTATGGSILVGGTSTTAANGSARIQVGGRTLTPTEGLVHLSDATVNDANLSALSLQSSGAVTFAEGSAITLQPGGALVVDSGRTISFNGSVSVPAGTIAATTHQVQLGDIFDTTDDVLTGDALPASYVTATQTPVSVPGWQTLMAQAGNQSVIGDTPGWFDIVVNPGALLSARGLWNNDLLAGDSSLYKGAAYTSGGSVSLTVAPHVAVTSTKKIIDPDTGAEKTLPIAVDISGSIRLRGQSMVDVSGGGYISPTGVLGLNGKGGNVSLIDETVYYQLAPYTAIADTTQPSGSKLFLSDASGFQLGTTTRGTDTLYFLSAFTPDEITSKIDIASDASIRSFGFKGGGTFKLVTPDLAFNDKSGTASGTQISLDFLDRTGFGTLDLSAWKTSISGNVFNNGATGNTALAAYTSLTMGADDTLNLTQTILPSILNTAQSNTLRATISGTDISRLAAIAPTNDLGDYDNLAANLVLGGMTELDMLAGSRITGAAGASITVSKLYSAGSIDIRGGSIIQSEILPSTFVRSTLSGQSAVGVGQQTGDSAVDVVTALSEIFGPATNRTFDQTSLITGTAATRYGTRTIQSFLTEQSNDHQIYLLGRVGENQGLVFASGSSTDLSGGFIQNPRLALKPDGTHVLTGRLIDGGSISALGRSIGNSTLFASAVASFGKSAYRAGVGGDDLKVLGQRADRRIDAASGATIDISGAAATIDLQIDSQRLTPTLVGSNAGTLSGMGGGNIALATIRANAGVPSAQGGTLQWYNPVLQQNAGSATTAAATAANLILADQITAAGFDSFQASGTLSTNGDVSLTLGRSFLLSSPGFLDTSDANSYSYYASTIDGTGNLVIQAPHIALSSILQTLRNVPSGDGKSSLTLRAQSASGAGSSFDISGAVQFGGGFGDVTLSSQNDIRLIGVQPVDNTLDANAPVLTPSLSGGVLAAGRLTFQARQVYATTGTGNLVQDASAAGKDPSASTAPYIIASLASSRTADDVQPTVTFRREPGTTAIAPYSAGSYILVAGQSILQDGALLAPLGRIDLGGRQGYNIIGVGQAPATTSLRLTANSVTSVSAAGLTVPYGTTTYLTDYFFTPTQTSALTAPPAAQLSFSAGTITADSGSTVDASGGGSLYAYEFVSGTGGSHDVLSRFNNDLYSGNNGYQYADGRQVYAILPANSPLAALYDPIYSADYAALYGSSVGKAVRLDAVPATATSPGLAAGTYILLPAKYAMLPGAMRIVENVGSAAPIVGSTLRQADNSVIVGGTKTIAGTGIADTIRTSFTVQSQDSFSKYSQITTTDAATYFRTKATANATVVPRLPNDAARLVIDPGVGLVINSSFKASGTTDADGNAGRGAQVDIVGDIINIVSSMANAGSSGVSILADNLVNLNAGSLLIGGTRTDNADGTTSIDLSASQIHVRNYATAGNPISTSPITLSAPEIILAVHGESSTLDISSQANIVATGTLGDTRSGLYKLTTDDGTDPTVGALLRVANGAERLVDRTSNATTGSRDRAVFTIGAATISGQSMTADTSRALRMDAANLTVDSAAFGSDTISFSTRGIAAGFYISPALEAKLGAIGKLTLYSSTAIGFTPSLDANGQTNHVFKDLVIDAPGIRLIRPTVGNAAANQLPLSVGIKANNVTLGNSFADTVCTTSGVLACGTTGNSLTIDAAGTLTLSAGTFRTYGFDRQVNLSAKSGVYYTGTGKLLLNNAAFNLATPFIADLGTGKVPKQGAVQADYEIDTTNSVVIRKPTDATATAQTATLAPGARFAIHALSDNSTPTLSITDTVIRATAGTIDLQSQGSIAVSGAAAFEAASYSQSFGPTTNGATDPDIVTVSASGGAISLVSETGNISFARTSATAAPHIAIGGANGSAGSLSLLAAQGTIDLGDGTASTSAATLSALIDANAPNKGASFAFDSGKGGLGLDSFVTALGSQFTGDIAIRTGLGDLSLGAGNALRATSMSLTADGGSTRIAGSIDTSGINGGAISLYGRDQVTLGTAALLDAHSTGYATTDTRKAQAGDVILGVGTAGSIDVASGARIDLGVASARAGNADGYRAVAQQQTDPVTHTQVTSYTVVEGDTGGTLTLRAPVVSTAAGDSVNVRFAGAITGTPSDVSVVGYRAIDLGAVDTSKFTGVSVANGIATLDAGAVAAGKVNILSDEAAGTIPNFIQNFNISAANTNLGSLTALGSAFHERPGVELNYAGAITLASTWNLGAGRITNVQGALAAGDLSLSPLSIVTGTPTYNVVSGREADLFQNYIHMLYRTGTGVNTGGEAGVFTFRAGRDLTIAHSISDGFFNFADQTDKAYLNYQLGGGTLLFQPTFDFICGSGCQNLSPGSLNAKGQFTPAVTGETLRFVLGTADRTLIQISAPYSDAANAAAAASNGTAGGGDPLGGAELFPLLSVRDANGNLVSKAATSSDIQLVAGAGAIASANPLHVDQGAGGSVTVNGSSSYDLATDKGTGLYTGATLLQSGDYNALSIPATSLADFKSLFADYLKQSTINAFPTSTTDLGTVTTRIQIGGNSAYSQAIRDFFDAHATNGVSSTVAILGTRNNPTGIVTTLDLAVEFLVKTNAIGTLGRALLGQNIASIGGRVSDAGTVVVPTLVRTGTGRIDIAAAKDVDLTGGDAVLRSDTLGKVGTILHPVYQRGGTAVYTAGHLVIPGLTNINGLIVDPTAYLPAALAMSTTWQPDKSGRLQANPVFATGGGDIDIVAGRDILGRRDVWNEHVGASGNPVTVAAVSRNFTNVAMYGAGSQRWRVGEIGGDQSDVLGSTTIRVNPQAFSSGVATLGGGDVSLHAGRDVRELTTALDTTLATAKVGSSFGSMIFGGGDLDVYVGGSIAGGRFDISTGTASFHAGETIGSSGYLAQIPDYGQASATLRNLTQFANLPEIRITDTAVTMTAGGSIALGSVSALGLDNGDLNSLGYYTGNSALDIRTPANVSIAGGPSVGSGTVDGATAAAASKVLPASLRITSFNGNIDLGKLNTFLYPSATGQLSLLAGGTLADGTVIDMDDGDPSLLPGLYSAYHSILGAGGAQAVDFGRGFYLPTVLPNTSDATRRLYHSSLFAQTRDNTPVRIAVGSSLNQLTLFSPKQTRVSAVDDIVNMVFVGQNLTADDATRIVAGRDITSTTQISTSTDTPAGSTKGLILSQGSFFAVGGPGALFMEAGRNLGPFLNSATIANFRVSSANISTTSGTLDFAGGILAVGNDYNPWLEAKSADIYAFFGIGNGMDFAALTATYLDPANLANLPGSLFEQNVDTFGNKTPDRSRPIYAKILIDWMQQNHADLLTSLYGTTAVTQQQAYDAFAGKAGVTPGLPVFVQEKFLLDKVYFNELASPAQPDGTSYLQYARGFTAVETLFPSSLGYTKNDTTGTSNGAARDANGNPILQQTGNLDLRLAAIQTTRDSNITLLGPGGNAILGSVIPTKVLATGRAYQPFLFGSYTFLNRPTAGSTAFPVLSVPLGDEGILTLRGGTIHSFTDGDLRLNQSRLFTQDSGDITLWSSNGDVAAGQGAKSASNVPPIVLRFDPNGGSEVDTAAGVTGAGIAAFAGIRRLERDGAVVTDAAGDADATAALAALANLPLGSSTTINGKAYRFALTDALNDNTVAQSATALNALTKGTRLTLDGKVYQRDIPTILLLAPTGTVDASDAGVRAAGDIVVAAAQVANADNFKVGGSAVGIPSLSTTPSVALPAGASAALVANVFKPTQSSSIDDKSRITVDVLGYFSDAGTDSSDERNKKSATDKAQ